MRLRWRVALVHRRQDVYVFAIGALVALVATVFWHLLAGRPLGFPLWEIFDPVVTVSTLTVALYVWRNEAIRQVEELLERRLFVEFLFNGRPVIRCDHAPLFGEGDIRALAQQIGLQVNHRSKLNLSCNIKCRRGIARLWASHLEGAFKAYIVSFTLWEDASATKQGGLDFAQLAKDGKCYYWNVSAGDCPDDKPVDLTGLPPLPALRSLDDL